MERVLDRDRFRRLQAALAGRGSLEGFTPDEIRAARATADARGRELYDQSTRTGANLQARTPAELQRLGATNLAQGSPESLLDDAKQQIRAGTSGAVDEITFGLADRALSAADAAVKSGDLREFRRAYDANMDRKRSEDAFDQAQYGTARTVGQVAGAVGGLAIAGTPGLGLRLARLAPNAGRVVRGLEQINKLNRLGRLTTDARGLGTMATTGGAIAGVSSQALDDAVHGRLSPGRDYLASAAGGALGGRAALRGGAVVGGAVAGAAINGGQSLVHGSAPRIQDLADAAYGGGVLGRVGGAFGKYSSNALPRKGKEVLGETLSKVKSVARGERIRDSQVPKELPGGGETRADHETNLGYVEAKFGPWADTTPRQKQALRELIGKFRVDHWLPTDIGQALGVTFGSLGPPPSRANGRR
jgi:hypothetical protein